MHHQFGHACAEQGQEEHFVHTGEAFPDVLGKDEKIDAACQHADYAGQKDATGQYEEDVHSQEGHEQNGQVRQYFQRVKGQTGDVHRVFRTPDEQQNEHGKDGCRQGDIKVEAEFILHFAALAFGGCDGGVGNHGKVVAEHGAPDTGANHQGHGKPTLIGQAYRDWHDRSNGSHGGAGSGAHESGDNEHAGCQVLWRNDGKAQVDRGIASAHGAGYGRKCACQYVDEQHRDNVFFGRAPGKDVYAFVEGFPGHGESGDDRKEHSRYRRELVEGHLHSPGLLDETRAQVDDDKNCKRQQGAAADFGVVFRYVHSISSFCE